MKDPTLHVDEQMGTYEDIDNYEYLWLDKDGKPRKLLVNHYWGPEHLGVQPPNPKGGRRKKASAAASEIMDAKVAGRPLSLAEVDPEFAASH